jgi:hypothetical protein
MKRFARLIMAGAFGVSALMIGDGISITTPPTWFAKAEARVGRPATPVSYAGVARRTTRRTVAAGTAAAATRCVTTYNSYGQAVTTCY